MGYILFIELRVFPFVENAGGMMDCPRTEEITEKLLLPEHASLLQEYIHRFQDDPQFITYHASTTILTLRVQLDLPFYSPGPCAECVNSSLTKCRIIEALEFAIQRRKAEQS
jgi:hypothetical protein